jgi:cardiolipin synthase
VGRGVRVRLLLDGIGSGLSLDNADVERLKEAGCAFAYYHPIASWRIDRVNRRTHRRALVVDGRVGFTGGVGFSDEWLGTLMPITGVVHARGRSHRRQTKPPFKNIGSRRSEKRSLGSGEFPIASGRNPRAGRPQSSFPTAPLSLVQAVAFSAAKSSILPTLARQAAVRLAR